MKIEIDVCPALRAPEYDDVERLVSYISGPIGNMLYCDALVYRPDSKHRVVIKQKPSGTKPYEETIPADLDVICALHGTRLSRS